jgi:hypothetical protein
MLAREEGSVVCHYVSKGGGVSRWSDYVSKGGGVSRWSDYVSKGGGVSRLSLC